MPFLNRNAAKIYYEVCGSGPAMLLTHGFAATGRMWAGQLEELSQSHTVVTWDMRGHGKSSAPKAQSEYSEQNTVADMHALLDEVGAEDAVVGGLSLGGYMSLAFHKTYPQKVKALLIIDTGPGFKNDRSRAEWNDYARKMADEINSAGSITGLEDATPEMLLSQHDDINGVVQAGYGMLTQHNDGVIQSLPSIKVPTLVLVGEDDKPYRIATDYIAQKIPNAEKVIIPRAGHAANLDQPEKFTLAVRVFLDRHNL